MNRKITVVILGIAFLVTGILIGRLAVPISEEVDLYMPELKIIGDVEEVIAVKQPISLKELIDMSKPAAKSYDVLLVGEDGLFAQLEDKNLEDCHIKFSKDNGWESVTERHPINSKIKRIKEIVVVSKDESWDYGFNLISPRENIINITPGELYLMELNLYPYYDGKSTKEVEGKDYDVKLYKQKKLLPIKNIVGAKGERLLMMGKNGVYERIKEEGYLELAGNSINYVNPRERKQIQEIKGIMIDAPPDSIMNVYHDSTYYLENDEDILIIFIDGFAYHQYEYCLSKGYIPFLSKLDKPKPATSVYKPVTNAGFAAMITGQPPNVNGVYNRKYRELKTQSIFGKAEDMNKKSLLVEGNIKILSTEIEPILNIDKNKNGTRDDEIFETALEETKSGANLMLVHFHSVDDMGHDHGDLAEETMETIKTMDGYVRELASRWKGKIIITSDHGMHKTSDGGSHGVFRYEDLIVPYFVFDGGGE